ncbi:MAG: hypothetical protein ACFFEV_00045 [Candidatus Thorarchaeota archaeon]
METIRGYFSNAIQTAIREVDGKPESYLLGVNVSDLVQFYFNTYQLPLIEKDTSRDLVIEKGKAIDRMHPGGFIERRDIPLIIYYPIIPKPKIEDVIHRGASTFHSFSGDRLHFNGHSLEITVYLNERDTDQENKITREIKELEKLINWRNSDVEIGNERLKTEISKYILQKQAQLEKENELVERVVEKVPIKLEKRTSATPIVDLTIRKEIKPVYPKAEKKKEPKIEKADVDLVIKLLKDGGYGLEKTPEVYSNLKEEQLRDILLSYLNIVFEGEATGETFLKTGKTDIYLRIEKGRILCAECKFWDGEKLYLSMIDQLFGYLTWRQNYGILITFSRNKDFTGVIEKAKDAAQKSSTTMKDSLKVKDESHFVTTNRFPGDSKKEVILHHLLFNLYFESKSAKNSSP